MASLSAPKRRIKYKERDIEAVRDYYSSPSHSGKKRSRSDAIKWAKSNLDLDINSEVVSKWASANYDYLDRPIKYKEEDIIAVRDYYSSPSHFGKRRSRLDAIRWARINLNIDINPHVVSYWASANFEYLDWPGLRGLSALVKALLTDRQKYNSANRFFFSFLIFLPTVELYRLLSELDKKDLSLTILEIQYYPCWVLLLDFMSQRTGRSDIDVIKHILKELKPLKDMKIEVLLSQVKEETLQYILKVMGLSWYDTLQIARNLRRIDDLELYHWERSVLPNPESRGQGHLKRKWMPAT